MAATSGYGTKRTSRCGPPHFRYWGMSGPSSRHGPRSEFDPNVWSGRALQEVFVELAFSGLASMYPVSDWS